jgi:hypothetical protein
MDKFTIAEQAYKNGYSKGFDDAMAQFDLVRREPSSRKAKYEMLMSEFHFCESIQDITRVISNELSWRVVMRIVHKMQRLRGGL